MKQLYRAATLAAVLLSLVAQPAFPQAEPDYDLRDITVGMPVDEIPNAGYADLRQRYRSQAPGVVCMARMPLGCGRDTHHSF